MFIVKQSSYLKTQCIHFFLIKGVNYRKYSFVINKLIQSINVEHLSSIYQTASLPLVFVFSCALLVGHKNEYFFYCDKTGVFKKIWYVSRKLVILEEK